MIENFDPRHPPPWGEPGCGLNLRDHHLECSLIAPYPSLSVAVGILDDPLRVQTHMRFRAKLQDEALQP